VASDFLSSLIAFIQRMGLPYVFGVFLIFLVVERWFYAEKGQSLRGILFNIRYTILYFAVATLVQPVIGFVTSSAISSTAGGWITPPNWPAWGAFNRILQGLIYLFIFDFFYYWFHRLQHTIPMLWSQHKLHHSDVAVNVTTTHRHHWLEEPLRMIFILVPMGIVFQVKPVAGGVIGMVLGAWGFFIHSNLRLNLGFLTPVFAGPQAHRIHHSIRPEHANRNYAAFFPLYDIAFGTFTRPKTSEFPPTGLHTRETVSSLIAASWWPFRENAALLAVIPLVFLLSGVLYWDRTSNAAPAPQQAEYKLGETVTFGQNNAGIRYLSEGWGLPEASHTWMNSNVAELAIPLSLVPAKMKASFQVRAFIEPQKLPKQRYTLAVNGEKLVESEIHSQEPVMIDFEIDKPQLSKVLRFTLEAPDAATPKDLGISPDERRLGLALVSIKLTPVN
jgi:sterol desaturase/sphingolipid hydroxylase (fatty acid hydroxylase superfamily)